MEFSSPSSEEFSSSLREEESLSESSKKKTPVILEDSESESSSSSEEENSSDEGEKNSITYDSESGESDKSSNSATDTEEEGRNNGCRDLIVINKLINSTSNIKEHKLSSNNLDKALHDARLLNTLQNSSKMVNQTKSKNKLKHIHFSPIIFVKLVIPAGKKGRQSKTQLVKALVNSGASESILAKAKSDKLPVKKTNQEQQWSTAAGILTTNTKQQQASVSLNYMLIN